MHRTLKYFIKPRLLFLAPNRDDNVSLRPIQIAIRVLAALLTTGWISFLPYYLFVIYMHKNKFFSYDFFVDGVFGLNTFVAASALLLIFLSLYFYGFILFAKLGIQQQKNEGKNGYRMVTWAFIFTSILMHILFFQLSLAYDKPYLFIWIVGISAVFCAFFYSFVGHGLKQSLHNWLSPVIFIATSMLLPLVNQDTTSEMVSITLRSFNMGGYRNIKIFDKSHDKQETVEQTGQLILLSPKNAYIRDNDNKLVIMPISDHTEIEIW